MGGTDSGLKQQKQDMISKSLSVRIAVHLQRKKTLPMWRDL